MTWFKVDDTLWSNPKVIRLSGDALSLWVRSGSYACQHLTDGRITRQMLRLLGEEHHADELVEACLWRPAVDGWVFHDWADYQETSTEVKERRKSARERQRRRRARSRDGSDDVTRDTPRDTPRESRMLSHGESRGQLTLGDPESKDVTENVRGMSRVTDGVTHGVTPPDLQGSNVSRVTHGGSHGTPTRPDPTSNSVGANAVATSSARDDFPALPNRCTAHAHDENPPACGACRDARLAAERAAEDHAARAAQRRRDELAEHKTQTMAAIEDCDLCDTRGYQGTRVCTHDPDAEARARRGIESARRALAGDPIEDTEDQQ